MEKHNLQENKELKRKLKVIGPICLGLGGFLILVAGIDFFIAADNMRMPTLFYLFFIAVPFIFVGAVMTNFGYMGHVARYSASQLAPVQKDVTNYMLEGTKQSIAGVVNEIKKSSVTIETVQCRHCGEKAKVGDVFCDQCGKPLMRFCSKCKEPNDSDAIYCRKCGSRI